MKTRLLLLCRWLLAIGPSALAQGTAFTCQRQLADSAAPANGIHEFALALPADDNGVAAAGTSLTRWAVPVANRLCSVVNASKPFLAGRGPG